MPFDPAGVMLSHFCSKVKTFSQTPGPQLNFVHSHILCFYMMSDMIKINLFEAQQSRYSLMSFASYWNSPIKRNMVTVVVGEKGNVLWYGLHCVSSGDHERKFLTSASFVYMDAMQSLSLKFCFLSTVIIVSLFRVFQTPEPKRSLPATAQMPSLLLPQPPNGLSSADR